MRLFWNMLIAGCLLVVSLSLTSVELQAAERSDFQQALSRVVRLQDYNTRIVLMGATLLGISGGIVGVFLLLRKRSLIGDVIGHSALPGIATAFLLSQMIQPGVAKNLPLLITGACLSGALGAVCVMTIDRYSRIKSDAALAIVLSLFYGLGTVLLSVVQRLPTASAAGLNDYLHGKTAALVSNDVWVFAIAALALTVLVLTLFKELSLLCFDHDYAAASGWPTFFLDSLLMAFVVGVTIIGMQSVGLILVVAILIIPASAARFWTDQVSSMAWIAAVIGALSSAMGTVLSTLMPKVATGPTIVLCGAVFFIISLFFGWQRGLFWRWLDQRKLQARIGRHDLLRAFYECAETSLLTSDVSESRLLQAHVTLSDLVAARSWDATKVSQLLKDAIRQDFVHREANGEYVLTAEGAALARRAARNHRLWEIYLITHAEIAPSHVDYDADRIEHILGPEMIRELESHLSDDDLHVMPTSPHTLSPVPSESPETPPFPKGSSS